MAISKLVILQFEIGQYLLPKVIEDIVQQTPPQNEFLNWEWDKEFECNLYDFCQYIKVQDTIRCPDQILIAMHLEDHAEDWVAPASIVRKSPEETGFVSIEIGASRNDFDLFAVAYIKCTSALPNESANL